MENNQELIDKLIQERNQLFDRIIDIDNQIEEIQYRTVKVINFRGAATYEMMDYNYLYEIFDVMLEITDEEYNQLSSCKQNMIIPIFEDIVRNYDYNGIRELTCVQNLLYCKDFGITFNHEKYFYSSKYPCDLYVRFGRKSYDTGIIDGEYLGYKLKYMHSNMGLKLLEVPIEVYNNFRNVCEVYSPIDLVDELNDGLVNGL